MLFLLLLLCSIAGIFVANDAVSQSPDVVVEIDGKPAYTFSLSRNRTLEVQGPHGSTLIEIRDKRVRIADAHCPNRLCMKQGWVSGGVIVCLPNRLVVFVGKGQDAKGVDAVAG
jgi:hypothetical protein